jgi:hypothetical protein
MLNWQELVRVVLVPLVVAAAIAGLGRWRRWPWAMPAAAGAGFLSGYVLLGVPRLPPRDGTDWLFWAAIPLTFLGIADAWARRRWTWVLGASAGAVAFALIQPLAESGVSAGALYGMPLLLAAVGAVLCLVIDLSDRRIGPVAVVAALCVVAGGTAVVVLSSNLRIVGLYGIAASVALGTVAVAVFGSRLAAGGSVGIVAIPIVAGLLVAGRYYPDPGVSWTNFVVLMASPLLLLIGAAVPGRRNWVPGLAAVVLVAVAVGCVAAPTALTAMKAAGGYS